MINIGKLNTRELVRLFGTDKETNAYTKDKRLTGNTKKAILNRANKQCDIEDLGRGNYIIKEIYENVCLEKFNHHPLYKKYYGIKQRCYNPNDNNYEHYGGRGIGMCQEWLNNNDGIKNFIEWSEANGFIENCGLSIDRINNDGNYEPNNCRYVTQKIQCLNRRSGKHRKNNNNNNKSKQVKESRIEYIDGLYLSSINFEGKIYPVGTYTTEKEALNAKTKLRTYLVNKKIANIKV